MTLRATDLARFPKTQLRDGPSPIVALPRLSQHLGGAEIYVKRDDVDVVVEAVSRRPGERLVVVGDGPERVALEQRAD